MNKELLENLVNQGYSTYKIAEELNSSQTNVRYWLKKFKLKTVPKTKRKTKYLLINWSEIQKFYDLGRTYRDLMKEFNLSTKAIAWAIKNNSLKLRSVSESLKINDYDRSLCWTEELREKQRAKAKANPNCGGETNYKRYSYKGITMDSSWEVDLAQWMDEENIKWIRSRKICLFWKDETGGLRRYYPDFYLPDYNVYLDPKNKYLQEKDKFKLEQVVKEQNVTIFSGFLEDIKQKIFSSHGRGRPES